MDFYRLMAAVEFAAASLCALLNVVIAVVFLRAYLRSRKSFFLLLVSGTLAWLYANLFAAAAELFAATHIRVFPASAARSLYALQAIAGTVGAIVSFIGMVLLVRFALLAFATQKT
jgi:hypothetical protein